MSVLTSFIKKFNNCSIRYINDNKVSLTSPEILGLESSEPEETFIEKSGNVWVFSEGSSIYKAGQLVSTSISESIDEFMHSYFVFDDSQELVITLSDDSKYKLSSDYMYGDDDEEEIYFVLKDLKNNNSIDIVNIKEDFYVSEYSRDSDSYINNLITNEEMLGVLNYFMANLKQERSDC